MADVGALQLATGIQVLGVAVATDQSTTSAAFVDVPGLTAAIVAGTYHFKIVGRTNSAADTAKVAVNGPTLSGTGISLVGVAAATTQAIAYDTTVVTNITTNKPFFIEGIVTVSASGTFAVRFASTGGASVTIKAGTTLFLLQVA
jgi:predicted phage tail protein